MEECMVSKKIHRVLIVSSFCFPLFSFSLPALGEENIYVGVSIGPESGVFKQNTVTSQPGNFAVIQKDLLGARGYTGSLFAGYTFNLCNINPTFSILYLALEGTASLSSLQYRNFNLELIHSNNNHATYRLRDAYSLSILPGFYFSDCSLFYGRLGYGVRNFRLETTEITIPKMNTYLPLIRYGLGVSQYFCSNFAVRLEYSWSSYKKTNRFGFDPDSSTNKFTMVAPKSSIFEIGLAYYF